MAKAAVSTSIAMMTCSGRRPSRNALNGGATTFTAPPMAWLSPATRGRCRSGTMSEVEACMAGQWKARESRSTWPAPDLWSVRGPPPRGRSTPAGCCPGRWKRRRRRQRPPGPLGGFGDGAQDVAAQPAASRFPSCRWAWAMTFCDLPFAICAVSHRLAQFHGLEDLHAQEQRRQAPQRGDEQDAEQ